jgi:four helix bundle protein
LRASQSIALTVAEGSGKTADADRRRWFDIARGSALECAAIEDVSVVGKALDETGSQSREMALDRMAAMPSRLGKGYQVRDDQAVYGDERDDFDRDLDGDAKAPQPGAAGAA